MNLLADLLAGLFLFIALCLVYGMIKDILQDLIDAIIDKDWKSILVFFILLVVVGFVGFAGLLIGLHFKNGAS